MALILVVDDDRFYLTIEIYRERKPAIVITDIFMPGMDGNEVIRLLRGIDARTGIIAVSAGGAFYDIDFLETAKKLGADAILRKLDPKERILAEIDRLLER